jgi:hypothetical protein
LRFSPRKYLESFLAPSRLMTMQMCGIFKAAIIVYYKRYRLDLKLCCSDLFKNNSYVKSKEQQLTDYRILEIEVELGFLGIPCQPDGGFKSEMSHERCAHKIGHVHLCHDLICQPGDARCRRWRSHLRTVCNFPQKRPFLSHKRAALLQNQTPYSFTV